jgi:hypothetical protein
MCRYISLILLHSFLIVRDSFLLACHFFLNCSRLFVCLILGQGILSKASQDRIRTISDVRNSLSYSFVFSPDKVYCYRVCLCYEVRGSHFTGATHKLESRILETHLIGWMVILLTGSNVPHNRLYCPT